MQRWSLNSTTDLLLQRHAGHQIIYKSIHLRLWSAGCNDKSCKKGCRQESGQFTHNLDQVNTVLEANKSNLSIYTQFIITASSILFP